MSENQLVSLVDEEELNGHNIVCVRESVITR